ncbi:MAG: outer membrane beta-barrel family protein [Prevotella sp.]|nr:outer membrane beta-barrel family protein [Prevotella sp.]
MRYYLVLIVLYFHVIPSLSHSLAEGVSDSPLNVEAADSISKEIQINEVVVRGDSVFHYADRDEYRITRNVRRNSYNTAEMLDKLPGFSYDAITKTLTFEGDKNIIVLVDSLNKGSDYVYNLHHARFDKVQVIRNPQGQYAGYEAIINLRSKSNYIGYDCYNGVYGNVFPTRQNGDGKQLQNGGMQNQLYYTRNKWNLLFKYGFFFVESEEEEYSSRTFSSNDYAETEVPNGDGSKNLSSFSRQHDVTLATDYQFNKKTSASVSYFADISDLDEYRNKTVETSTLSGSQRNTFLLHSKNRDEGSRQGVGLYYRGALGKWGYNTTFNYVNRSWETGNHLSRSTGYLTNDDRHQQMNHILSNLEANRRFGNDKWYVSMNYSYFWKRYEQFSSVGDDLLSSSTQQYHHWSTYLSYDFSREFNIYFSGTMRTYLYEAQSIKDRYAALSGRAGLYRKLGDKGWVRFSYDCNLSNPNLEQTTSYGYFTDSLMWYVGNQSLRPRLQHFVQLRVNLKQCLTLRSGINYTQRSIVNIREIQSGYLQNGVWADYVATMPQNGKYYDYFGSLNFNRKIGYFFLNANARYDYIEAQYQGYKQTVEGWYANCRIGYNWTKQNMAVTLSYSANKSYDADPQGKSKNDYSLMSIAVRKSWMHDKLTMSLTYSPPFVYADMSTEVDSPGYHSYYKRYLKEVNCNRFSFNIGYRISGGKSVRDYNREMSEER